MRTSLMILCLALAGASIAQTTAIQNKHLIVLVDRQMKTGIKNSFATRPVVEGLSHSEYLQTKYFPVKDFVLVKTGKKQIHDDSGAGVDYTFYGRNAEKKVDKILSVKIYDRFPDAAYFQVSYVNNGPHALTVNKWVNHQYHLVPDKDSVKFWSFQGSSHSDRRDWISKISPGFTEKNYMGMNDSDYGGGIPVVDLWRRDAGIAIGLTDNQPRLISLPVDYDKYAATANISLEYEYPLPVIFEKGDTLKTFGTFVSVHAKDCFATLQNYGSYMATRGIKPAPSEPNAFEPVWCAWGYEKSFTLQQILNTLPKVKELGIKWVGLDDGFQQSNGDWHTNKEHFPGGDAQMKAFVDSIHAQGMKAVIWWAPLAMDPASAIFKTNPNITLIRKDGSPQFITYWNAYYMAPTDSLVRNEVSSVVKLFLQDWGFDALKLDGQHMNAVAPDYGEGHGITAPEQSFEQMPRIYQLLFETARSIKPDAVVEFCPCGDCMNFYHMPYTNQFVASDPLNSWQVRLKGKVYKALMPTTAYFGDHVELTDDKQDFASQVGIGAVPGTKFTWPATGNRRIDHNLLTPQKEELFKKYLDLYRDKLLSKGQYHGELYDLGYDYPETHCIEKDGKMYYAFYAKDFDGELDLRGLDAGKTYEATDYFNNKSLGTVKGTDRKLKAAFKQFLLLEVGAAR